MYIFIHNRVMVFCRLPSEHITQQAQNICITFIQCWTNVEDVGPMLHKCYTNVLYLLGIRYGGLT